MMRICIAMHRLTTMHLLTHIQYVSFHTHSNANFSLHTHSSPVIFTGPQRPLSAYAMRR